MFLTYWSLLKIQLCWLHLWTPLHVKEMGVLSSEFQTWSIFPWWWRALLQQGRRLDRPLILVPRRSRNLILLMLTPLRSPPTLHYSVVTGLCLQLQEKILLVLFSSSETISPNFSPSILAVTATVTITISFPEHPTRILPPTRKMITYHTLVDTNQTLPVPSHNQLISTIIVTFAISENEINNINNKILQP